MNVKNIILVAAVVAVVAVVLLYGIPGGSDTEKTVTTNITIKFYDAPAPINEGNITTWELIEGNWQTSTVENSNETVWVFKNITSKSNCYDQVLVAAGVASFQFDSENQTMGIIITSIAGDDNLEHDGRGWQYFVNDVYANRACNYYSISNGDEVVWKYIPNQLSE